MSFFDEFVKGCFELGHRVLTLSPSRYHILGDLNLSSLVKFNMQSPCLLLDQHALIQDDSSIAVLSILIKNYSTYEFSLPKARVIGKDLC